MLIGIWAISYQYFLLYFLIIGLKSFFIRDVAQYKAIKNLNVLNVLSFAIPSLFWNYLSVVSAFGG